MENADTFINHLLAQIKKLEIQCQSTIKNKHKSADQKGEERDSDKFSVEKVLGEIEELEKKVAASPSFEDIEKLIDKYQKVAASNR